MSVLLLCFCQYKLLLDSTFPYLHEYLIARSVVSHFRSYHSSNSIGLGQDLNGRFLLYIDQTLELFCYIIPFVSGLRELSGIIKDKTHRYISIKHVIW